MSGTLPSKPVCLSQVVSWFTTDQNEKSTLGLTRGDDPTALYDQPVQGRAPRLRLEQALAGQTIVVRPQGRNTAHELEARLLEPPQDLAERVFRFMRVQVLVGEPGPSLVGAQPAAAQDRVDPARAAGQPPQQVPAQVGRQPSVAIIKAQDEMPAGFEEGHQRLESAVGIGRVMVKV